MSFQRSIQRRALGASNQRSQVQQAVAEAKKAVAALNQLEVSQLPDVIRALEEQTGRAERLASALADDYATLLGELEIQREVLLRMGERTNPTWRELEAETRARVIEERAKDAQSASAEQA